MDAMRAVYGKPVIPELPPEIEHDWLASVDETYYSWEWNRKGSMFAGQWIPRRAA